MRQMPLPLAGDDEPRFDNFLAGANAAALEHLQAWTPASAPVYLWGPAGSGKTHLLRALLRAVADRGGRGEWFEPGFDPDRLRADGPTAPAVLAMDDVHRLDEAAQADAFRAFVEAATNGVAVAAAGRVPPVDLPLRDDLRTRLGWGPVFELQPPGEPQVRAALRREADRRGLLLGDEVMAYLLTRFARDLKSLMQLLGRLDAYALAEGRALTIPLVRRMVDDERSTAGEGAAP